MKKKSKEKKKVISKGIMFGLFCLYKSSKQPPYSFLPSKKRRIL